MLRAAERLGMNAGKLLPNLGMKRIKHGRIFPHLWNFSGHQADYPGETHLLEENPQPLSTLNAPSKRLISLDAFRGLTIAGMIIVNTPGDYAHTFAPLLHAEWSGLTPTDLVFPFFLFIVGVSIVLAFTKKLETNAPKGEMYLKILFRTLKIFGLGVLIYFVYDFDFANMRIVGVLQRIALVFGICSVMFLNTNWKTQAWIGAACLLLYWALMYWFPVPEIGAGMLEPGQNFAAWLDSYIVPGRMYRVTWDPEGFASTLPAIGTGVLGMLAGKVLVSESDRYRQVALLFVGGFVAFLIGSAWNWVFPINKHLWTSSYVMYAGGTAAMTLATMIWLVDIKGVSKWTHFAIVLGSNAIAAYTISEILPIFFGWEWSEGSSIRTAFVNGLESTGLLPELASLAYALFFLGVCYIPVWVMWKRKIFLKL